MTSPLYNINILSKRGLNFKFLDGSTNSLNKSMTEKSRTINQWYVSFEKGKDFDSWGQLVEAADEYSR